MDSAFAKCSQLNPVGLDWTQVQVLYHRVSPQASTTLKNLSALPSIIKNVPTVGVNQHDGTNWIYLSVFVSLRDSRDCSLSFYPTFNHLQANLNWK